MLRKHCRRCFNHLPLHNKPPKKKLKTTLICYFLGCYGLSGQFFCSLFDSPSGYTQLEMWLRVELNQNAEMAGPFSPCALRDLFPRLAGSSLSAWHLGYKRASPNVQVLIKPLFTSHLLMSHCSKQSHGQAQSCWGVEKDCTKVSIPKRVIHWGPFRTVFDCSNLT